ncbi:MAG: hypothetical protein ABI042_10635 [Verrucomicrobiota bacterium]
MRNEIDIVREVSQRFDHAGIAYILTGSMAMNYYAEPRMTRDIDIVIALALKDVDTVTRIFGMDYYVSRDAVSASISNLSMFHLIHNETVIKIDCIVQKRTDYRVAEFGRRQRIQIDDFETWIVSKEDLIISKLEWAKDSHSETQLRDVRNLVRTGYDQKYLQDWTVKLGLNNLLQECSHE